MKASQLRVVRFRGPRTPSRVRRVADNFERLERISPENAALVEKFLASLLDLLVHQKTGARNIGKSIITIDNDDRPGA
jgi:hypothetical protein